MNNLHRQILIEIESYWNNRMCELVNEDRFDDSDALYLEFVVDGEEPDDWIFVEDLDAVF